MFYYALNNIFSEKNYYLVQTIKEDKQERSEQKDAMGSKHVVKTYPQVDNDNDICTVFAADKGNNDIVHYFITSPILGTLLVNYGEISRMYA